jgi:NAD-dependent deacetylase
MSFPPPLIDSLRRARRLAVLTGAGISAESGVPTFRDAQTGLWAQYNPTELATPEAFQRNPKLVWEWYAWRRELIVRAAPNPGHRALVEIERRVPRFSLITQNVDGLHRQAGSQAVIELHGNIHRTKCFDEDTVIESWAETGEVPPRCPRCGGSLRPDVVWFGEAMPHAEWSAAVDAAWSCDVFLCIGASALAQPAASLPYRAIKRSAITIEINPDNTPLTPFVTHALRGKAGEILPAVVRAVWP